MNIKTERSAPVDSNALVPVALGGDHHISLIQHKHGDLFGVNELVLGAPVVDCARCTNDNLLLQLGSSLHWTQYRECSEHRLVTRNLFFRREYKHYHILTSISPNGICQLHIWTKFPHLLNDLTSLQCELVRRCDAKALKEKFFWPSEYISGSDKRIPAVSRDWKCCDTLRMFCLPESTYCQGLHGWAWPEKMQQFYLCQTATVQSDSEVWKQKKVDMKKWINHRKTRCAEDLKGFLKFWLLRFFFLIITTGQKSI